MTGDLVTRLAGAVERAFGLRIDDRRSTLTDVLARRSAARGEPAAAYLARIERAEPGELRELAEALTVGETYFFRHAEQIQAYGHLLAARPMPFARVLSAGCSSGEEPYSLAIAARERGIATAALDIQGCDVNPAALHRAARARYARWALRATPDDMRDRWFRRDGHDFVLAPEIARAVRFVETNLVTDRALLAPERWHVVFCRNVTMYFAPEVAQDVLDRLARSLVPGGHLFLGHAEALRDRVRDLELCHTHGTFYYRRPEVGATFAVAVALAPPPPPAPIAPRVDPPAPPAPRATPAPDELARIRLLFVQERFVEATDHLARLAPDVAASREAVLLTALVLTHTGRLPAAELVCGELLALDPESASAHYLLAICRDSVGQLADALDHARLAGKLDPSFAMARVQHGLLARRTGDLEIARRELAAATVLLEQEDDRRLALFGGGLGRAALVGLCRSELASLEARS